MAVYTNIKGPVNYTAIGTMPTISEGIASNFTTTSGLMTDTDLVDSENWEMQIKFYNTETSNNYIMLIGTRGFGMDFVIASDRKASVYLSSTGNSWNYASNTKGSYIIPTNQWIYYKLIKTPLLFQAYYSLDGLSWTKDIEISMPAKLKYSSATYAKRVAIGFLNENNPHPFSGQIDLNETYVNVNCVAWFGTSFSKVKVRRGLINYNYTIVGSPTIDNNIVSGFSNSNYIKLKTAPSNVTSYEIQLKFKTTAFNNRRVIGDSTTNCHSIQLEVPASNETTMWYGHPSSSHGWNGVQMSTAITTNTWYWFKAIWNGTKVSTYISIDGYNWVTDNTVNTSTCGWDQATAFGYDQGNTLTGFIDLNECYMIVNGEYIFRGSKQSSDSYKIQTDNILSGYYIIEDGKLLWANPSIYLQFSGGQYINTSFNANQDTRVKMKALTTNIASNQGFFVGRNAAMVNTFAAWVLKDGNNVIFRDDYNTSQNKTTCNVTNNTIYNIDFNKNEFYVNDTLYSTTNYALFQSTYPIIIGASTRYTTTDANYGNFLKGKIYKCQIYDNDTLVRHFVPVPTGMVIGDFTVPSNGMFDIVNQQFYPNRGSGTFTYGKD